ncbi:Ribosomal RNA small subunit methyltransferase G [gamma proteobacterium IMCC1989]|nr:Ribosomal RNA small subunit methyltransferase G [gamma proteobacterium IMCC1989]
MIDNIKCEKALRDGVAKMNIVISDKKIQLLMAYLSEFVKWNKAYNLSAIRDPLVMVEKHLLDSLVLVPFLEKEIKKNIDKQQPLIERIIDVGTGGGLPGIPLAIIFPEIDFTLLDSNGKKTRFLFQVKTQLALKNVTIENTRVESYQPEKCFSIVMSRAFASLQDMVVGSGHLLLEGGRFWAMKGVYPENELRDCEKHAIVDAFYPLTVPNMDGERHLLVLTPVE